MPANTLKFIRKKGFTLIELLVVIAIIGLLASIVVVSLSSARAKSRDARRLADMKQIQTALALYYDKNAQYPNSDFQGCFGWETPGDGDFISPLRTDGFWGSDPKDPKADDSCGNYRYFRYSSGEYGCDVNRGAYYVLGAVDMETSNNPHPSSLGWSCPGRDWQPEFDWVTGSFEQ